MITISTPQSGGVVQTVFDRILVTNTGSVFGGVAGITAVAAGEYYIKVAGHVDGDFFGIAAHNSATGRFGSLFISATGTVTGVYGLQISGAMNTFTNLGTVEGGDIGLIIDTNRGNTHVTAVNVGTIFSVEKAILIKSDATFAADVTLRNTGTIIGGTVAFDGLDADSILRLNNSGEIYGNIETVGAVRITNRGLIDGEIMSSDGADVIINYGTITGIISTGGGLDEVYTTKSTSDVYIHLGAGDDVAYLGNGEEVVYGEAGLDAVSYEFKSAIVLNLANLGASRGAAAGDTFDGVEHFIGSNTGDDTMIGDALGNSFFGSDGDDQLFGGAGDDTLGGGFGTDRLTGGAGRDLFRFHADFYGADVITDFVRGNGRNGDKIAVQSLGFGDELAVGKLAANAFRSGLDNLAQDADDRFVFRTTDDTLWFDRDGVGGVYASVLLCTFANGINLAASDILVF